MIDEGDALDRHEREALQRWRDYGASTDVHGAKPSLFGAATWSKAGKVVTGDQWQILPLVDCRAAVEIAPSEPVSGYIHSHSWLSHGSGKRQSDGLSQFSDDGGVDPPVLRSVPDD
jgi:hypothetical protein